MNSEISQPAYNSICLYYVVYKLDWPNLYMSLRGLAKHWKGPKTVAFVAEDNDYGFMQFVKQILQDWTLYQVPPVETNLEGYYDIGWYRQQIQKLYLPTQIKHIDWFISLDCKNILVRDADPSSLLNFNLTTGKTEINIAGAYLETHVKEGIEQDPWQSQIYREGREVVGGFDIHLVPYTISPWVFNGGIVRGMWERLQPDHWTDMKSTEYILYWYTVNHIYTWKPDLQIMGTWKDEQGKGSQIDQIQDGITLIYNSHIYQLVKYAQEIVSGLVQRGILEFTDIDPIFKLILDCEVYRITEEKPR
jgi:hypothetical protein